MKQNDIAIILHVCCSTCRLKYIYYVATEENNVMSKFVFYCRYTYFRKSFTQLQGHVIDQIKCL